MPNAPQSPIVPPKYLLGKLRRHHVTRRFTAYDVADMRRWAQREGHGLALQAQAKHLAAVWSSSPNTMREILSNQTWYDAAYERTTRLTDTPTEIPVGFLSAWIAILQLFFGEVTCSPSRSTEH